MNHDSQYWYEKLKQLELQVTSKQRIERDELTNWVSECVAVFSHLNVGSEIIKGFMNLFESSDGYTQSRGREYQNFEYWSNPSKQADRIKGFFYPNIAFTTARALIENIEEQERIVPQRLIDLLKSKAEYSNLVSSLESIQASYHSKDIENQLASTLGLLACLLNLHPNIFSIEGIKNQLKFLSDKKNKSIINDFGVDSELFEIFHIFRYLRNKVSAHKVSANPKVTLPKPPISVGYGFTSLVLLLLYGVMDRGVLIVI